MLDLSDAMQQAIVRLKHVLPLLRKLGVPPNPLNYALWYAHISGRRPELSLLLDKIEKGQVPYDEELAQALFRDHVCMNSSSANEKVTAKLQIITGTLSDNLRQSIDCSAHLDQNIQGSCQSLQSAIDSADIAATVNNVISLLEDFKVSNQTYRCTMQNADEQINELRIELERSQQRANVDELTQLFNRATFYRELQNKIMLGGASQKLCVVLIDLDYFKAINDNFGHLVGDRVLQRIGALLLEKSRDGTLAARYGGEEFALILAETNLAEATLFAERLRGAINKLSVKIRNSDTVVEQLTASFGIANLRNGDTAETLFERADKALYLAKESGRNTTMTEVSL